MNKRFSKERVFALRIFSLFYCKLIIFWTVVTIYPFTDNVKRYLID